MSLEKALDNATRKIFDRSVVVSDIQANQILALLHLSKKAQRSSRSDSRVPFEPLLMKFSPCYRKTKYLSKQLKIKLVARKMTKKDVGRLFDTKSRNVLFSPLNKKLVSNDYLGKKNSKQVKLLLKSQKYFTLAYHDINHVILFSVIEPGIRISPFEYYCLIEALAYMRDLQLIEELGRAARPLYRFEGMKLIFAKSDYRDGPMNFKKFSFLFEAAYEKILKHPDTRKWYSSYSRKFGKTIRRPEYHPGNGPSKIKIFKINRIHSKSIFNWYKKFFGEVKFTRSLYFD